MMVPWWSLAVVVDSGRIAVVVHHQGSSLLLLSLGGSG